MTRRLFRRLQWSSRESAHGGAARRGTHVRTAAVASLGVLAALGCSGTDGPAAGHQPGAQPVRFAVTSSVTAAAGAVIEALVTYVRPGGTTVTLARDTVVIGASGTQTTLPLAADVAGCRSESTSPDASCTVVFTLRLKRDGRLLDESAQPFVVTAQTQQVQVPAITLYEVATVSVAPSTLADFEPGDSQTLTATAVDRGGTVVTGRQTSWEVVNGNVTLSSAGVLRAVGAGDARIRATIGGRQREFSFTVGQSSVATLTIAPLDTLVPVGGNATYRIVARSAAGDILAGRAVTYSSSSPTVASMTGSVATAVSIGTSTITARSTEGRAGAIITTSTTLRVEAAPPILVDRSTVPLDSLAPGTVGAATTVAVTTSAGRSVGALRATVTYTPNVTPWLTATLNPLTTPTSLALQASSGSLPAGDYVADVRLTSATDPHQPATVRVTLRVVPARRVTLNPRIVSLGTFDPSQTTGASTQVTVTSSNAAAVAGLTARIEYLSTATGWLTATLQTTSAPPSTPLTLIPRPLGLATGTYQARVIVTSTSLGASPDTLLASMTVAISLGRFAGIVVNPVNGTPLANASVTIRRASDNVQVDQFFSATNGSFTSSPIPAGTYLVVVSATGFESSTLVNQVLTGGVGSPIQTLPTALLVPVGLGTGTIVGFVRDATTAAAVFGATVELRLGTGNTTGAVLAVTTTNSDGQYSFVSRPSGNYTIRGTQQGFAAGSVNVAVFGTSVTAPLTFLSPGTGTFVWRFVLSWGAQPADLDAHLTGPLAASAQRFVVFYGTRGSLTVSPFAQLDIDQTSGFGPETITIAQQIAGVYRYYVNNFSQQPAISSSSARVDVYRGNSLTNQYFVPQGSGLYWTVFEIDGSVLTPINTIGTSQPSIVSPYSAPARARLDAASEAFHLFPPFPVPQAKHKRP